MLHISNLQSRQPPNRKDRLVWNRFQTGNDRIKCDEETAKKVIVGSLSWESLDMVPSENA